MSVNMYFVDKIQLLFVGKDNATYIASIFILHRLRSMIILETLKKTKRNRNELKQERI